MDKCQNCSYAPIRCHVDFDVDKGAKYRFWCSSCGTEGDVCDRHDEAWASFRQKCVSKMTHNDTDITGEKGSFVADGS